jgi:hypothetical protein
MQNEGEGTGGRLEEDAGAWGARREEATGMATGGEGLYQGLEGSEVHAHLVFHMFGILGLLIFVFNGVLASSSPSLDEGLHSQITIFRLHQV